MLMTPPGRGAIATVCVEGRKALETVSSCFTPAAGRPLESFPINRIVFGRWRRPAAHRDTPGEEVVVCRREETIVEIHCHGGRAASAAILEDLRSLECVSIDWSERPGSDPIATEARAALAQCSTERVAAILLDQYRGALRLSVEKMIHFVESGDQGRVLDMLTTLVDRATLGIRMTQGWKVALAGPPNVGKSSIMNALVGYRRALVRKLPGTTRDLLNASIAVDGWPIELTDTAGLRTSDDEIEAAGVARARKMAAQADLVLLVYDVAQPWSEEDRQLMDEHRNAMVVYNKCDLPHDLSNRPSAMTVSALRGGRIAELASAIASRLVPDIPPGGEAIPFTSRQIDLLRAAKPSLDQGDSNGTIQIFHSIIGSESFTP